MPIFPWESKLCNENTCSQPTLLGCPGLFLPEKWPAILLWATQRFPAHCGQKPGHSHHPWSLQQSLGCRSAGHVPVSPFHTQYYLSHPRGMCLPLLSTESTHALLSSLKGGGHQLEISSDFIIKSLLKNERYLQSNLPFQHTSFHWFPAWRSMPSSHPHLSKGPKEVFLQLLKELLADSLQLSVIFGNLIRGLFSEETWLTQGHTPFPKAAHIQWLIGEGI